MTIKPFYALGLLSLALTACGQTDSPTEYSSPGSAQSSLAPAVRFGPTPASEKATVLQAQALNVCGNRVYGAPQAAPALLHADGDYFRDQQGRVVMLRGVNASGDAKIPDFQPIQPAQFDPMPGWGLNTLRLLFNWEAFEGTRCQYNQAYLDYYKGLIQAAQARGIYVIVDFHQDAFSRWSIKGCGEGFPEWAIAPGIARSTPKNDASCSGWGPSMIFDLSHHDTWREFHHDTGGVQTSYVNMVREVASQVAQYPNVVGYEVMNEPWGFDDELARLYERVGAAIRERDPNHMIFVPPHALGSSGMPNNTIPNPSFGNVAYSPHFYDPGMMMLKHYYGNDLAEPLGRMKTRARAMNAPMILSEFGSHADVDNAAQYMEALYTWMDKNFVSGTQWNWSAHWTQAAKDGWNAEDLSIVDDQNHLRPQLYTPRAYPQYTAGTPISFTRTAASPSNFQYTWNNAPWLGETVIYLPSAVKGQVQIDPGNPVQCQQQGQALRCAGGVAGKAMVSFKQN